jgi:hypothetical protein
VGVAFQAEPEAAAFCRGDGGVAFAREGADFRGVVGGVFFGGRELELAGAAVLNVLVEGGEVGSGDLGGGSCCGLCGR